jgi:hypothetical protein
MRFLAVVLVSTALIAPIAIFARAPYRPPGSDAAVLRFSWRMSIPAREHCRARTQQELDALPVHMRTLEICTRTETSYALVIRIDEQAPDTIHLVRGGVKGDRPLFVLEQRTLHEGTHRIRSGLERTVATGTELLAALDTTVEMKPGVVRLTTLPEGSHKLTVLSAP